MSLEPTTQKYHPLSMTFHWVSAGLWGSAWLIGLVAVHAREALNPHHGLTTLHKAIASVIIFLSVLRVIWRLQQPSPSLPLTMSPAMRAVAHAAHYALYAFALFALPLSGWYWSSVADKPILVLGLIHLPPLVAPAPEMYTSAKTIHQWAAWLVGVLVVGHVAAAIKHHVVDKDGVLQSMLPGGSGKDH